MYNPGGLINFHKSYLIPINIDNNYANVATQALVVTLFNVSV